MYLSSKQKEALDSDFVETFLLTGIGFGKSFILGIKSFEVLKIKGAVILIAAPIMETLNKSTIPAIVKAWSQLDFNEGRGRDFVINKAPPKHWGVEPKGKVDNRKILTTRWGSYAYLMSLENYDAVRGAEYDEAFVDEFRDVREEARTVLLGRLRAETYTKLGLKHKITYATTPPENPLYLQRLIKEKNKETKFIYATTFDNLRNLPANYISNLYNTYDSIKYRREVLGELINLGGTTFGAQFDAKKHVKKLDIDYNEDVYLSFDFNLNPMTCIATQRTINKIHTIKEFRINGGIYAMLPEIKDFLKDFSYCYVTGDSTGMSGHANQRENVNFYTTIINELGLRKDQIKVPKMNPHHSNSYGLCNSILQHHDNILIDESCIHLIEDLETVKVYDDLKINKKDGTKGHLLDCWRYQLNTFDSKFLP
jgi:hypothetical protein